MSNLARDHRNSDISKIHIAKKQLNLSEEEYRSILIGRGGADSAKDLDHLGRKRVLEYFEQRGFKPKPAATTKRPSRPTPSAGALALVRRIRQLISLDRLPDAYADGIAQQMLGTAVPKFFEWCIPADLYRISQALGIEKNRKGAPTK